MKIKKFETTSPLFSPVSFENDKPICFFAGASVFLHMMRCLLDGEDDGNPIDESKARAFVSKVDFETEANEYELCGVLCDDKSFFVGACDGEHFSEEKTDACLEYLKAQASDEKNYYCTEHNYCSFDDGLCDIDYYVENFNGFMDVVRSETEKGDMRPIYVFDFDVFGRMSEAAKGSFYLDELASLGRQVFVSVKSNYPTERMRSDKVQVIRI